MDIAVSLVESYLRFIGYLTVTELDVSHRTRKENESVTDVDVRPVRFSGDLYAIDVDHGGRVYFVGSPLVWLGPKVDAADQLALSVNYRPNRQRVRYRPGPLSRSEVFSST